VTDRGWAPRSRQVGITGRSIAPRIYVALGLSGKFNHVVGFALPEQSLRSIRTVRLRCSSTAISDRRRLARAVRCSPRLCSQALVWMRPTRLTPTSRGRRRRPRRSEGARRNRDLLVRLPTEQASFTAEVGPLASNLCASRFPSAIHCWRSAVSIRQTYAQ